MKHQFLEAGRIVRTHGVRGELVLECWADSPESVSYTHLALPTT